jgi:hypothetical protein
VADDWGEDATRRAKAALISTSVPSAARVVDYLNGGQNNFEADRRAARTLAATAPAVVAIAPAVRAFQQRVLRFLVTEAGIRQFLDIGTGLPLVGSTHEVAQSLVPECRITYVDNDPMVLSHARALMKSAPGGAVGYVDADVRDPATIVEGAKSILDFSQPVAVMLLGVLHLVSDAEDPWAIVARLMDAVPPGSYLVISHPALDIGEGQAAAQRAYNQNVATAQTLRTRDEFARFFTGLELVEPGLVQVHQWHPNPEDSAPEGTVSAHGGVAAKAG